MVCPCSEQGAILAETRDAWERAYVGVPPTRGERAAGELIEALDAETAAARPVV